MGVVQGGYGGRKGAPRRRVLHGPGRLGRRRWGRWPPVRRAALAVAPLAAHLAAQRAAQAAVALAAVERQRQRHRMVVSAAAAAAGSGRTHPQRKDRFVIQRRPGHRGRRRNRRHCRLLCRTIASTHCFFAFVTRCGCRVLLWSRVCTNQLTALD